jgi:hypothetical protein
MRVGGACLATREGRPQTTAPPINLGTDLRGAEVKCLPRLGRLETRRTTFRKAQVRLLSNQYLQLFLPPCPPDIASGRAESEGL